jgi:cellulose synthase/poly-beta-1,6-N-acetylglucosamine synthase-like glycosyltransferase
MLFQHEGTRRFAFEEDTTPTITFQAITDDMLATQPMPIAHQLRELLGLGPRPKAEERAGPRVLALLPAHNEGLTIAATIEALQNQTRPPDWIYVFTDNCTDYSEEHPGGATAETAFAHGVSVASTVGNNDRKAGNLNRALGLLLPTLRDDDIVMGFDADSVPGSDFIANALKWLGKGYGAVGATFHGRPGGRLLGLLQRSEFARFARHQHRKLHCDVLSGTGWALPAGTLRRIAASRPQGTVYDVAHITEDFELTLAARRMGIAAVAPADCSVTTDVMEHWRDWGTQRLRWQHGTLFALRQYGWARDTREMIIRQILIYVVMIASPLTALYMIWSVDLFGWQGINPLNAPIYAIGITIVVLEQAWQARRAGSRAIAATLLIGPDLLYSAARQVIYTRALWRLIRNVQSTWGAGTSVK